jgi:hypothetical protein
MALAFGLPRLLQRSSAHGIDSAGPKQQGCCSNIPASLRRMVGTYYTTEGNFNSTLILNNKGPNQIAVTPILHSQNGQTFTASPVAVGGESSQEVDLNALASTAGPQFRSGSFEFTYNGRMLEMGGGLRIVDSRKSLIFDEQMLEPGMKFSSARLEAVYAVPFDSAKVSVMVTNTTAQPVAVEGQATFAGLNGRHPVRGVLRPYEMSVVDLPPGLIRNASAGAVSINHNGAKGALLAMIHVQDSDRGYSESVNFTDPAQGKTAELHGAGLRLGSVNNESLRPVIAVRNIGSGATTVTASVPYSKQNGGTGKISLPQLSLAPGEIKLFDASNPQLRQRDFSTAGLEIKYTGAPGSVIASATSVSQSGNHVFALPLKDPQGGMSSTGGYPWFINETSSTVVFIKNVTNEQQEFMLNIIYTGGHWGSNVRTLAPGQTFALDVRRLRDSQEKGSDGSVIPLNETSGHVSWSLRGNRNKVLIGRAQMVDFSNGIASTYECQCLCGWIWDGAQLLPGSVTGFPGSVTLFQVQSRYRDCFGNDMGWQTLSSSFVSNNVTHSSDNSGVATFTSPATGTAIAPGSTYLRASWTEWYYQQEYIASEWTCVAYAAAAACAAFCDVQNPSVTIPDSLIAVGKNYSIDVNIGVSPPSNQTPITLSLSTTSGTGQARFTSNNSTTLTITQTSTVNISGITESSTSNNIFLEAKAGDATLAGRSFTVVEVTLSLRTSGQFSADNAARNALNDYLGSYDLGTRFANGTGGSAWSTVVEIVGTVKPSNFTHAILIDRTIISSRIYQESSLLTNLSKDDVVDTSLPFARDDDPQPNGKVYDADGPTMEANPPPSVGTTLRRRTNFYQYAWINTATPARVSANLNWYCRLSVIYTSSGFQLSNSVQGDNVAAAGTTNLSWNLQ